MLRLTLAVLLIVGAAAPALANQEMHPGARVFFPLWDVRTSAANPNGRLTFIILTRLSYINQAQGASTIDNRSNCTTDFAVDKETATGVKKVIPVHLEYYDKNCVQSNEVIYMSCADIDLILLSSQANTIIPARGPFAAAAVGGVGALDVHLMDGPFSQTGAGSRANENSLMGNAIITDTVEGWAAVYPGAVAKSTFCPICDSLGPQPGTPVGYEPYPMEVFLPFALADASKGGGGLLTNFLSLWAPTLLGGSVQTGTSFTTEWTWYDGRERPFNGSTGGHSILRFLGTTTGDAQTAIDPRFNASNFDCGLGHNTGKAENDGAPRGSLLPVAHPEASLNCDPLREDLGPGVFDDLVDPSDNFDNLTTSRPIGWWDFIMVDDSVTPPIVFPGIRSGRGMAGVVLTSGSGGEAGKGVGDAIRLWHKDPCEIGPRGLGVAYGPPHVRDAGILSNITPFPQLWMVFFNVFPFDVQGDLCEGDVGPFPVIPD
jgi:hypothetical protein